MNTDLSSIVSALDSPLSDDRINALKVIRARQNIIEAECVNKGYDLVGKLLELYARSGSSSERWESLFTVLGFDDDRSGELAREVFVSYTDNKFMVMAANRIFKMAEEEKALFLTPILLADGNKNRIRLCSNLLAGNRFIDTRAAIRVSVIADREFDLPDFDVSSADVWIDEMQGAYAVSTRKRFLELESADTDTLLGKWDSLAGSLKVWVLDNFVKNAPDAYRAMLNLFLKSETSDEVIASVFSCVAACSDKSFFDESMRALLSSESDVVRSKAVCFVSDISLLKKMMETEHSSQVLAAMLRRLAGDERYINKIAEYFSHPHPMVRAASVDSMVHLAPKSEEVLKELLLSEDLNVKTAVVRALHLLGVDEHLES